MKTPVGCDYVVRGEILALRSVECQIIGPDQVIAPYTDSTARGAPETPRDHSAPPADGRSSRHRGVISGLLNLSRNLGLITGASLMGAIFALATATSDIAAARPEDIATGMRTTFGVAATLIIVALGFAVWNSTVTKTGSCVDVTI